MQKPNATIVAAILSTTSLLACVDSPDTGTTDEAMTTEGADKGVVDYSRSVTGMLSSAGNAMTGPNHLYFIFYGTNWTQNEKDLYVAFANGISGSPAADVLATYYDGSGNTIPTTFSVGTVTDAYSQGSTLTGAKDVIEHAISSLGLPRDPRAVYMVMPDDATQTTEGGVDTCGGSVLGWHNDYTDSSGNIIKTAMIYNRKRCKPSITSMVTANGDALVDLSVSAVWHEYAEAATNPSHDGWTAKVTTSKGDYKTEEVGDLCEDSHTYDGSDAQVGAAVEDLNYNLPNGSNASVHLNTRDWKVQNMWQNTDRGGCVHRLALARPVAALGGAVTGDLDGNGIGDLIWRDSQTGQVSAWLLDASDAVISSANIGGVVPERWQVEGLADFNHDGRPDLLWRDLITGELVVWDLSGTTVIGTQIPASSLPREVVIKAVGDFDGNGRADLLFEDYSLGGDVYRFWLDDGNPMPVVTSLPTVGLGQISNNVETVGTGDFDHIGGADILWRDNVYGYFYYWSLVNGSFQQKWFDATGTVGLQTVLGIVDVDRDGVADLVGVSSDGGSIAWTKVNGPSLVTTNILGLPAQEWRYTGGTVLVSPNRVGILWRNRRTGDVARWALDTTGHFTSSSHIVVGASQHSELVAY